MTKTFILAAAAALSLGVGTAMAQEGEIMFPQTNVTQPAAQSAPAAKASVTRTYSVQSHRFDQSSPGILAGSGN